MWEKSTGQKVNCKKKNVWGDIKGDMEDVSIVLVGKTKLHCPGMLICMIKL